MVRQIHSTTSFTERGYTTTVTTFRITPEGLDEWLFTTPLTNSAMWKRDAQSKKEWYQKRDDREARREAMAEQVASELGQRKIILTRAAEDIFTAVEFKKANGSAINLSGKEGA